MEIEEKEIVKSISILRDNKKTIFISILILIFITLVLFAIYKSIEDKNDFYYSEQRRIERRLNDAKKDVDDKKETYRYYLDMYKNSELGFIYEKSYEDAKEALENALNEEIEANEEYLNSPISYTSTDNLVKVIILLCIIIVTIFLLYFYAYKMEINLSKMRIYGKKGFGLQFSIPIENVSFINTFFLKGISINTNAGKIHLIFINDNRNICNKISECLINDKKI